MEDCDIVQCVQTVIEIGHSASLRAKPTKEGFTHDWTVFVRGQEGCEISHFVEKVVFHLHHTFSNPRRVVKVPPYCVSEAGYAGFDLPIEIFFKSRKEPRKIMFNYNLFLQMYEPVSFVRCEKLTFQKPTDEFKEKLINAGRVLVLPLGKPQFADIRGVPTKTESHNKQKQPLISKENVSKQMLNFSGKEMSSNKQENNSNDHDAASSRRSNSSSIMVSTPSPSASQKRASDSSIPNENKPKKAKRSSSVSSERVRREDKQRSEHNENKDKVVKRKDCENKDESQSKYHKKDTSKQKSSKNSKEEKKESNLKDDNVSKLDDKKEAKDDKKEAKDDKKEVRDDKKKLMDDKKEFKKDAKDDKKDAKDDKKDGKDDNKVQNDTKEVKDIKRKVQNDKNKVINKSEVQNDKKEVKHDQIEIKNDRKDVKDHRNGHNEVKSSMSLSKGKNGNEKISSNRNKQSEITTDAKSEHRKRPGSPLSALDESLTKKKQDSVKHSSQVTSVELKEVLSLPSKTYNQMYSKSALKILMDELEDSSSDDDITATVDVFCQQKSVAKISPSVEPSKASPAHSCKRNPKQTYKAISENSTVRKPTPPKERQEKSATKSVFETKSESSNISDIRKKTQNIIQPLTKLPSPVTKSKNEKNSCSVETSTSTIDVRSQSRTAVKNLVVKTKSSTSSEHRQRLSSPLSALDESLTEKQKDSVKRLSQVTSLKLKEVSSLSSKTSNQIHSKSALKILMDELEYILSDDAHDLTATIDIFSRRKSLAKISSKDTHERSFTSEEELIKLAELEKILMGIKDLSVLQKAVKLILSSRYFEINDEMDSELSALNLNLIRDLENFVATKI